MRLDIAQVRDPGEAKNATVEALRDDACQGVAGTAQVGG